MPVNTFRIAVRKFGPFESAMQKLWDAFCLSSGCTLHAEMVPMDLLPLHKALIEDNGLANGDWDVAHISTDWLYEAYVSGALEDLEPYISASPPDNFPEGWSPSLLTMQQFGREIVGLPFHDGPECMIYRKDLFDDPAEQERFFQLYRQPLRPPATWDEFRAVARFFNRPEENRYGAVFAGFPDGHNTVFDFCLQLWSRGGSLVDGNGAVRIDTSEADDSLSFYRSIIKDASATHPGSAGYESVQAGLAFARGEAALMINWFGFASFCEVHEQSAVKGRVDITTIPAQGNTQPSSLNVYWLYGIGAGSRLKQTAYDFIRFAINCANDKLLTLEGGIGCRISTWNDSEVNNLVPYYHKLEMLHNGAKTLPQKSRWAETAAIIDEVVIQAIQTDQPVAELLRAGQAKINQLDRVLT